MSAVRLARAATGRRRIVKTEGGYHGHADGFLVSAGSGVATLAIAGSPGVAPEVAALTVVVPYNDAAALEAAFERFPGEIAAFMESHAGRVVVKPRGGSGSTGVYVLETPEEAAHLDGVTPLAGLVGENSDHGSLGVIAVALVDLVSDFELCRHGRILRRQGSA